MLVMGPQQRAEQWQEFWEVVHIVQAEIYQKINL